MKTSYIIPIISFLAAGAAAACDPAADEQAAAPDGGVAPPGDARCPTYYEDRDGDKHGNPKMSKTSCTRIEGWVESSDDCNDTSRFAHPRAPEVCDGIDNDCKAETSDQSKCPTGCQPAMNPLTSKTYLFCSDTRPWHDASAVCKDHEFHLVQIDDARENEYVNKLASTRIGPVQEFWLGGSDAVQEDVWTWLSGVQFWQGRGNEFPQPGSPIGNTYSNWPGRQPDNSGSSPGEDCLTQWGAAAAPPHGFWNDQRCDEDLAFVCERD